MSKVLMELSVSLDGFVAGPDVNPSKPSARSVFRPSPSSGRRGLPDVFERWRVTEENQDEAFFWTQEGAGGSLGVALSLALDGEVLQAPPFEGSNFQLARARWRRDVRTFEEDWMPAEVGTALSEVARLSRFPVTQWKAE